MLRNTGSPGAEDNFEWMSVYGYDRESRGGLQGADYNSEWSSECRQDKRSREGRGGGVSTFDHRGAANPRTAGAANRRTANSSVEGGGLLVRGPQSGSGEQLSPPLQGNGCGTPKNRRSSTPKNCTSGAQPGETGLAGAFQVGVLKYGGTRC